MTDGTPLRRFGHYRVRQPKRRTLYFVLVDEHDDAEIARSCCKETVEYVGERIGAGRMLVTPREHEAAAIEAFPSQYPTRHRFASREWLGGTLGDRWINGGPVSVCNTDTYSPAGRAWERAKALREREWMYVDIGGVPKPYKGDVQDDYVRCLYAEGRWPDVDGHPIPEDFGGWPLRTYRKLDDVRGERCPLHDLLTVDAAPEWIDAGREAMRLLLRYGVDDEAPMRSTLRTWAEQLAAKHGGRWVDG